MEHRRNKVGRFMLFTVLDVDKTLHTFEILEARNRGDEWKIVITALRCLGVGVERTWERGVDQGEESKDRTYV